MVQVLHSLPKFEHADLIVGVETSDDAGVFRLRPDLAVVNTVDFFTPIVDDPYLFGQIAAANALSDIFAMGGEPKTALNIVCFPKEKMDIQVLGDILRGGADKAREAGVVVVGGHSVVDEEIKYGMAITGVIHPDRVFRNIGIQEGDALILTKALGTGIITTALKKGKASKESLQAAIASMATLNNTASAVMRNYPVHACSDVTGYGLLGHALEMASGSSVTLILESSKLPLLHRTARLAQKGYLTGGCKRNREYLKDKITIEKTVPEALVETALDPQTSGGLLIALPQKHSDRLVQELQDKGVKASCVIGYATSLQKACVRLV
ncbi:MAG: selenide, water dikinase SelD [Deltaproteobacteria bacterium]|nr:selenide, water dikinase SelD [Deltaproteobacteria bacterium]